MVLPDGYDLQDVNRYILEETDFVGQTVESLPGYEGFEAYDVAMAVRSVRNYKDLQILEKSVYERPSVRELGDEIRSIGDNLDRLEEAGFIERKVDVPGGVMKETNPIPSVLGQDLSQLYLNRLKSIDERELEEYWSTAG